jgi:hypothetical protein
MDDSLLDRVRKEVQEYEAHVKEFEGLIEKYNDLVRGPSEAEQDAAARMQATITTMGHALRAEAEQLQLHVNELQKTRDKAVASL